MDEIEKSSDSVGKGSTGGSHGEKIASILYIACSFLFVGTMVLFAIFPQPERGTAVPLPLDEDRWNAFCNMLIRSAHFSVRQTNGWHRSTVGDFSAYRDVLKALGGDGTQILNAPPHSTNAVLWWFGGKFPSTIYISENGEHVLFGRRGQWYTSTMSVSGFWSSISNCAPVWRPYAYENSGAD